MYHVIPKIPPAVPAIVLNQWTKTPYAGFLSGLIRYKSLQIYQHNTNWSHHPTPWNVLKKGVSGSRRGCFTSPGSLRPPETSIASLLSGLTPIRRFWLGLAFPASLALRFDLLPVGPSTHGTIPLKSSMQYISISRTTLTYRRLSPKLTTFLLQTVVVDKSSILQIFPYSKFWFNLTTGSKVLAKLFTFSQQKVNFLAITFLSVNWLISNFPYGIIRRIGGLFAKAVCGNKVVNLVEKWLTWKIISCVSCVKTQFDILLGLNALGWY